MSCDNNAKSPNLSSSCLIFPLDSSIYKKCISCNNSGIFNPESYFSTNNFAIPGPCIDFFNSVNPTNVDEYKNIRLYMYEFFNEFENIRNCKITDDTQSLNYSSIQPNLYYVCSNYGGFCEYGLNYQDNESDLGYKGYCSNVNKENLSDNTKNLSNFCGCHLNTDQYLSEYDSSCDTICLPNPVIKKYTDSNIRIACTQPICIISNVTINVYESDGSLSFSQLCGSSCVGNSCAICIMQDVSINDVESLMDVNFLTSCGKSTETNLSGFICYETIDGIVQEVECEYTQEDTPDEDEYWRLLIIITICTIISIIVIGIIILIIIQIKKSNESKNVN